MKSALRLFNEHCLAPLVDGKQNCRKYIVREFGFKPQEQAKDRVSSTVDINNKWNRFSSVLKRMADEDFWLNAPEDCEVSPDVDGKKIEKEVITLDQNNPE